MNLLLAFVVINLYGIGLKLGIGFFETWAAGFFFTNLALINMLLMLFNLLPVGPLDGSYIFPYALPPHLAQKYRFYNQRFGAYALLVLIALHFLGVPVFETIWKIGNFVLGFIRIV
jgi:Zn-dependent protease